MVLSLVKHKMISCLSLKSVNRSEFIIPARLSNHLGPPQSPGNQATLLFNASFKSAKRVCQAYDEVHQFFRPCQRMAEFVSLSDL